MHMLRYCTNFEDDSGNIRLNEADDSDNNNNSNSRNINFMRLRNIGYAYVPDERGLRCTLMAKFCNCGGEAVVCVYPYFVSD